MLADVEFCFENAVRARKRASTEEGRRIAAAYHSQELWASTFISVIRQCGGYQGSGKDKNLVGVAEARNDNRHWVNLTRDSCRFAASERSARWDGKLSRKRRRPEPMEPCTTVL